MVVLADADSIAAVPASRWPALTMHSEVIVLLLGDPLERDPPRAPLPFATPMHRVELDLGVASQRQRWLQEFVAPVRSEEHPSELQSLKRSSSAVFCLTKKH